MRSAKSVALCFLLGLLGTTFLFFEYFSVERSETRLASPDATSAASTSAEGDEGPCSTKFSHLPVGRAEQDPRTAEAPPTWWKFKPLKEGDWCDGTSTLTCTRELYLHTLEMALVGSLYDWEIEGYNADRRVDGTDWPTAGESMIGHLRMRQLRLAVEDVLCHNIPGDIAEFGVWRGGAMVYAAGILHAYGMGNSRRVFLGDIFGPMPEVGYGASADFLAVSLEKVKHAFFKFGIPLTNIDFEKGLFSESMPRLAGREFAILRIDANFYDSYQDALYFFYEGVPVGGYIIFDDVMSHPPVSAAWKDFKADQGLVEDLIRIDVHSAYFKKQKEVKINWSKFHEYKDASKGHPIPDQARKAKGL